MPQICVNKNQLIFLEKNIVHKKKPPKYLLGEKWKV